MKLWLPLLCASVNGMQFIKLPTHGTWEEARKGCIALQRELVSVHSAHDNEVLNSVCGSTNCWIGLTTNDAGEFAWTDGSDVNWFPRSDLMPSIPQPFYSVDVKVDVEDPEQSVVVGWGGILNEDIAGVCGAPTLLRTDSRHRSVDYRLSTSLTDPTLTYQWLDLPNAVILDLADDEVSAPLQLGFSLPFWGVPESRIVVSSNGWLSFDGTYNGNSYHTAPELPYGTASLHPHSLFAFWWDDLVPGRNMKYQRFTDQQDSSAKFVLQLDGVTTHKHTETVSLQAILRQSGALEVMYKTMPPGSATIGVDSFDGDRAIEYTDGNEREANMAIRFAPITCSPACVNGSLCKDEGADGMFSCICPRKRLPNGLEHPECRNVHTTLPPSTAPTPSPTHARTSSPTPTQECPEVACPLGALCTLNGTCVSRCSHSPCLRGTCLERNTSHPEDLAFACLCPSEYRGMRCEYALRTSAMQRSTTTIPWDRTLGYTVGVLSILVICGACIFAACYLLVYRKGQRVVVSGSDGRMRGEPSMSDDPGQHTGTAGIHSPEASQMEGIIDPDTVLSLQVEGKIKKRSKKSKKKKKKRSKETNDTSEANAHGRSKKAGNSDDDDDDDDSSSVSSTTSESDSEGERGGETSFSAAQFSLQSRAEGETRGADHVDETEVFV